MGLMEELDSVSAVVLAAFPTSNIKYQVPKDPKEDTFVIRSYLNKVNTETAFHVRTDRTFQILYYSRDVLTVIECLDKLTKLLGVNQLSIPFTDGSRNYIRIKSFGYNQPIEDTTGFHVAVCMMETEVRTARDQETYEKIMHVYTRLTVNP